MRAEAAGMSLFSSKTSAACQAFVWLMLGCVVAGLLPVPLWPVDLLAELRPHLILLALLAVAIAQLVRRRSPTSETGWRSLAIASILTVTAGIGSSLALGLESSTSPPPGPGPALRSARHHLNPHHAH